MPTRVLDHRNAPTTSLMQFLSSHSEGGSSSTPVPSMHTGKWSDLSIEGQFLIDLEFLTRYTQPAPPTSRFTDTACVYTKCPPYLLLLSYQFPWIHFYAFAASEQTPEKNEYDPEEPDLVTKTMPTLHTEYNRTVSPYEFSKESAVTLSKAKEARPAQNKVVMICHGETATRQLALHALLRADFTLMDICGPIPEEYLEGELILPIYLPVNRMIVSLVSSQACKCAMYDPDIFKEEIGQSSAMHQAAFTHSHRKQGFSRALCAHLRPTTRQARI